MVSIQLDFHSCIFFKYLTWELETFPQGKMVTKNPSLLMPYFEFMFLCLICLIRTSVGITQAGRRLFVWLLGYWHGFLKTQILRYSSTTCHGDGLELYLIFFVILKQRDIRSLYNHLNAHWFLDGELGNGDLAVLHVWICLLIPVVLELDLFLIYM